MYFYLFFIFLTMTHDTIIVWCGIYIVFHDKVSILSCDMLLVNLYYIQTYNYSLLRVLYFVCLYLPFNFFFSFSFKSKKKSRSKIFFTIPPKL